MSFLYDYVRNIAVFIIFSAFVEIIVPNEKYRGYIKSIFGFFIIIIILTPIFNIFGGGEAVFDYVGNEFNKTIMEKEGDFYDEKQKEIIRENFVKNLEEQSKKILDNLCVVHSAQFYLKDDSFDIDKAEFVIEPKEESKSFFRIEKIETQEEKDNKFFENVKKIISDFYNLHFDNINIRKR